MTLSSGVARTLSFQTWRASISRETTCSLCRSRYSRSSNSGESPRPFPNQRVVAGPLARSAHVEATPVDGRGVQGIHRLGQLHSERLVAVEVASGGNQDMSEIGVDPPVAVLVGVGQRVARNLSPETRSEEHTS